jgi:hypothetical protein
LRHMIIIEGRIDEADLLSRSDTMKSFLADVAVGDVSFSRLRVARLLAGFINARG